VPRNEDLELACAPSPADILGERRRTQRALELLLLARRGPRRNQPVSLDRHHNPRAHYAAGAAVLLLLAL